MRKKWKNDFYKRLLINMMVLGFAFVMGIGCSSNNDNGDEERQVILINLGDSYANGIQGGSGNVNQYTQVNSYAQVIADQIKKAVPDLNWNNPLLDMDKNRLDTTIIPYNVGVDGATVQTLLEETTDENEYMQELLQPIPEEMGLAITQLEAAEYVAGLHDDEDIKIITLFIGGNDFMGIVNAGGGTELTSVHINAFLNDQTLTGEPLGKGHDLASMTENLTAIVNRLKAIPNSYIFIGNLPSVTGIAGLFNAEDIERLAVYDNPYVTALADDEYMGFVPFGGFGVLPGLGGALAADNATLDATIQGTLAAGGNDAFSLTSAEEDIIEAQLDEVNAVIEQLVDDNSNVYLVDLLSFFESLRNGEIQISGDVIGRGYGAGLFSPDGFHPSNAGYALIATEFIQVINETGIIDTIPAVDLASVWSTDPYRDKDGDGYFPGPSDFYIIDSTFIPFLDCDDEDNTVYAPFPTAGMAGSCQ